MLIRCKNCEYEFLTECKIEAKCPNCEFVCSIQENASVVTPQRIPLNESTDSLRARFQEKGFKVKTL